MQRLIDADALKKSIEELKRSPWFNSVLNPAWHAGIKEALEVVERLCIDKAPTIDAVPVIRCKDCKYNSNTEGNYVNCVIIPQMFGKTPDDNYCSWAERKQDEH